MCITYLYDLFIHDSNYILEIYTILKKNYPNCFVYSYLSTLGVNLYNKIFVRHLKIATHEP